MLQLLLFLKLKHNSTLSNIFTYLGCDFSWAGVGLRCRAERILDHLYLFSSAENTAGVGANFPSLVLRLEFVDLGLQRLIRAEVLLDIRNREADELGEDHLLPFFVDFLGVENGVDVGLDLVRNLLFELRRVFFDDLQ